MKMSELKLKMKVEDTWYNNERGGDKSWGIGRVVDIKKTKFTVKFSNPDANNSGNGLVTYDKSHAQFVRPVKQVKKKSA